MLVLAFLAPHRSSDLSTHPIICQPQRPQRTQTGNEGPKFTPVSVRSVVSVANSKPRLQPHHGAAYFVEIGLLHEDGSSTLGLVLIPVNSICTPKSPSNLSGSNSPLKLPRKATG